MRNGDPIYMCLVVPNWCLTFHLDLHDSRAAKSELQKLTFRKLRRTIAIYLFRDLILILKLTLTLACNKFPDPPNFVFRNSMIISYCEKFKSVNG